LVPGVDRAWGGFERLKVGGVVRSLKVAGAPELAPSSALLVGLLEGIDVGLFRGA